MRLGKNIPQLYVAAAFKLFGNIFSVSKKSERKHSVFHRFSEALLLQERNVFFTLLRIKYQIFKCLPIALRAASGRWIRRLTGE